MAALLDSDDEDDAPISKKVATPAKKEELLAKP